MVILKLPVTPTPTPNCSLPSAMEIGASKKTTSTTLGAMQWLSKIPYYWLWPCWRCLAKATIAKLLQLYNSTATVNRIESVPPIIGRSFKHVSIWPLRYPPHCTSKIMLIISTSRGTEACHISTHLGPEPSRSVGPEPINPPTVPMFNLVNNSFGMVNVYQTKISIYIYKLYIHV